MTYVPYLTYDQAVAELKTRYAAGDRDMLVSPAVYQGYLSGLTVMTREGGRPNQDVNWLAFKAAKVRMAPCE